MSHTALHSGHMTQLYDSYVRSRTLANWKFWIVSFSVYCDTNSISISDKLVPGHFLSGLLQTLATTKQEAQLLLTDFPMFPFP